MFRDKFKNSPLLHKSNKLLSCNFHQSIHLILWAFEVLNTEGIDSNFCDAQVQAPI